jgi:uncharacterized repeat protein (TIGR03847 family)
MERAEHDFGRALAVDAEAIGEPGHRRFRLLLRSSSSSACIWMEKEQLAGIAAWFEETLDRLDKERPSDEADVEPLPFGAIFALEFQAAQIGLGYVEDEDVFALHAFDAERYEEEDAEKEPTLRCFLTRGQCRTLTRKIAEVVAAGRPICPLCERPMDPGGHTCPRGNGHLAGATS